MSDFWKTLQPNERRLIAIAGVLSLVVIAFQFVLTPLFEQRERAQRALASALATQADVALMTKNAVGVERAVSNQPLQAIVTDTASVFGLSINRLAPAEGGRLNLWLEQSDAQVVYYWLNDMSRQHGVDVERAMMRREDNGKVSASFLVSKGE